MDKIINIWIVWFQGRNSDQLPLLNKECINAWEELNKNSKQFKVNFLDEDKLFFLLPDIKEMFNNSANKRTLQAKSDLARLMLLNKYGGIWADSSVFPIYPMSYFYSKIMNDQGFFAYRFFPPRKVDKGLAVIPSWFLVASKPNHYIISQWLKKIKSYFMEDFKWDFFLIHHTFSDLYYSDSKFSNIIDNIIQLSEENPHSITNCGFESRLDSFLYKRPVLHQSILRNIDSGQYEIKKLKELIINNNKC